MSVISVGEVEAPNEAEQRVLEAICNRGVADFSDLPEESRLLRATFIEDLIASLHALKPRPIVIVMSSGFEYSRMLLMAGADAFVSKGDPPNWLLQTLRRFAKRVNTEGRSE